MRKASGCGMCCLCRKSLDRKQPGACRLDWVYRGWQVQSAPKLIFLPFGKELLGQFLAVEHRLEVSVGKIRGPSVRVWQT